MSLGQYSCAVGTLLLLYGANGFAAPRIDVSQPQKTFEELQVEQSAREESRKQITPAEKALAEKWQLNEQDWLKFKDIMTGPRGKWNPNLDPITVLGVEATSDVERRRYAEIWVRVQTQRTEKELAFERARMAAAKRLYPDTPMMESRGISKSPAAGAAPQHYVMFGKINCRTCASLISSFASNLRSVDVLDIYVADARNDEQVRQFAAENAVSIEQVARGQITLNRTDADKRLAELGAPTGELPMVYGRASDTPWQRMH